MRPPRPFADRLAPHRHAVEVPLADRLAPHRRAVADAWRLTALAHGGAFAAHDGVVAWSTGLPVREWNGVMVVARPHRPKAAVRAAARAVRDVPWGLLVPVELEPALARTADAAGLRLAVVQPCMVLRRPHLVPVRPPAGTVVRAAHADEVAAVQSVTFGDPPDLAMRFVRPTVGAPGCVYLAAVADGVTACVGEVVGPGAPGAPTMPGGIYGVATLPAYRRRGLAAALTTALVELAFGRGSSFVHLNPSPMGEGVYRRLGFRTIPGMAIWLPPEATDEPGADGTDADGAGPDLTTTGGVT